MTPFRGESSTWASVWPGGSESIVVGAVCPVIVDAIVGRLSEKAAVIHSWLLWHPGPIPLVCVCLSWCCAGCLALALGGPRVCGLPPYHRGLHSSPCCSASVAAWLESGGAAAGVGCGHRSCVRKTSLAIAAHTEDGRVKGAFSFPFLCMWLLPFLTC